MKNNTFIDTSGWANLFIKTEPNHQQAVQWFTQARRQKYLMVTTNYIVLELVALLNSPLRVPRPILIVPNPQTQKPGFWQKNPVSVSLHGRSHS